MQITDKIDRVDAKEKLKGELKYLEDINFKDLHFARTLRSTIAKGKILKINYPEKNDEIYIVDASDVKHLNEVAIILKDMPVFAKSEVNYFGEPIALVIGKDKNRIIEYYNQIEVEYEESSHGVYSMEEALSTNSTFANHTFKRGDLKSLDYDEIFEREYSTGYQEQVYMEKQGVVGNYEDGVVTVYGSLQCPYYVQNALKHALDLDDKSVRVIQTPTGGAFGGKEEYPSLLAIQVAIAAKKVGKPVRLIFDRREDMAFTTKRHPSKTRIKTYIKNSKMLGIEVKILLDSGPYLGLSDVVLQRSIFTLTGCYNIKNLIVNGVAVKTNNIFTGAFRGFGAPQSMFALEQHINQLSRHLNVDPIKFRRKYFVNKGDTTSTNGVFNEDIFLDEIADKLIELSNYDKIEKQENVGYGVSFIPHGGGFTGDGEAEHIKAVVKLKKSHDKIHILVSNVEMGQGAKTALSKIVASVLDINITNIIYNDPDTFIVPDSGPTAASRTTMVVGKLLYDCAKRLKEQMHKEEVIITEHFKQPDYVKWDQKNLNGNAYMAYSWSAIIARVEVDDITYETKCTDIYAVYDVGIPIDEKLLLGQIHGGIVQGLGYGLMERMTSEKGLIQHHSFASYVIPTAVDVPRIHSNWVENRFVDGPFGAKSVGELTLVGVAPAVASAIENATGKEIYTIPVTPERVLEAKKWI